MKRLLIIVFLAVFWAVVAAEDQPYTEIVSLGVNCTPHDTCHINFSRSRDLPNQKDRTCACDQLCTEYGDCCVDGPRLATNFLSSFTCFNMHHYGGVFLVASCPRNWTGDPLVRRRCEEEDGNATDPVSSLPVTDTKTGITFKNFHCATCHYRTYEDLKLWQLRFEFVDLSPNHNREINLTELVLRKAFYMDNRWGVNVRSKDDGREYFYEATVDPELPINLEQYIRFCRPNLTDNCASDWSDEAVRKKCHSYQGALYLKHSDDPGTAYRNVYCAICNHINVSQLVCKSPVQRSLIEFRSFNPKAFTVLIDISDRSDVAVGQTLLCPDGEIYDVFFKRCRSLSCFSPNQVVSNGKCVNSSAERVFFPTEAETTAVTELPQGTSTLQTEIIDIVYHRSSGKLKDDTTNNTINLVVDIGNKTSNVTMTDETCGIQCKDNQTSGQPSYSPEFVACSQVRIAAGDFNFLGNGSIEIPVYGKVYIIGNYRIWNNAVFVCAPNVTSGVIDKFSPILGYLTLVGLSISMVCLFLHVIFFIIVPDWQNISSKNLASLSVALFTAYLGFVFAQIENISRPWCTFLAIVVYYFFLSSFFWMNTLAFDVWRTLRMATHELRVSRGRQWCRYFLYSIYGWFVPAAIVTSAVVIDNADSVAAEFRPGFGVTMCWFRERKALLVFFAVPLIVVMVTNFGFFASSARMIMVTTKGTVKHSNGTGNRRNFRLYLKLAVMMGLSWSVGLVASYLELETLWYVFVVLNTLQGLFIFVAFTWNSKVKKFLCDKMAFITRRHAYRTSSLNSGSGYNSNSTFPSSNVGYRTSSTDLKTPISVSSLKQLTVVVDSRQ